MAEILNLFGVVEHGVRKKLEWPEREMSEENDGNSLTKIFN